MSAFRLYNYVLMSLLVVLLPACSSLFSQSASPDTEVNIADGVSFTLLAPHSAQARESVLQSVSAHVGEEAHDLLVQVETSPEALVMVALTTTGTRLATITLENGEVSTEQLTGVAKGFQAEQLLAAYQLSRSPLAQANAALKGQEIQLTDLPASGTEPARRLLTVAGDPVIDIVFSRNVQGQAHIVYQHMQWQYRIAITTLERHSL